MDETKPFFDVFTWRDCEHIAGFHLEDSHTNFEVIPALPRQGYTTNARCTEVIPFGHFQVLYFDYFNTSFGVIDLSTGREWSHSAKGKGEFHFLGVDETREEIVVQIENRLFYFTAASGDPLRDHEVEGRTIGYGSNWSIEEVQGDVFVYSEDWVLPLNMSHRTSFWVNSLSNYLMVIEHRGPLRVIDLALGEVITELPVDPNSRFAIAALGHDRSIVVSQHFFDEPRRTHIITLDKLDFSMVKHATVEIGGRYCFSADSTQVIFATRKIHSTADGSLLGVF